MQNIIRLKDIKYVDIVVNVVVIIIIMQSIW